MANQSEALERAKKSLERIQKFDTATLPREAQLGQDANFNEAVEPANRVTNLFRQFPIEFLPELPTNHLQQLGNQADSFYNLLSQIETFNLKEPDAYNKRNQLIETIRGQYEQYFVSLHPLISYGASRQRDFSAIERDFRASIQRSEDAAGESMQKLQGVQQDAQRILDEVRKVAAEQGVSQQASYFQAESASHEADGAIWRNRTIGVAGGLALYAVASIFLHKVSWLTPVSTYEAAQLALSKLLIFAVLAYVLLLCARNFLSHKHNAIVNKHRQNALLTFNALVNAAGSDDRRDVILTYAAACIFAPQDTGYSKVGGTQMELPASIIQAIPRLAGGGSAPH
ncbi:hypothetical protein G5V57_26530 [Nordella sp. HKS 07]|uniref:hypothetical protein n=1 Tax=Nordella sp. HKS 07 TaxID=2712222 RepID=UPI0013E0F6DA|nr:hypothetical protein [Nordella sp. HKS 07]QIG50973.1 hypothetical protein G5V57_26530 [Nordella sp. HKS 07]